MSIQSTLINQTFRQLKESLTPDGAISLKPLITLASATESVIRIRTGGGSMFVNPSLTSDRILLGMAPYPGLTYAFKDQFVSLKGVVRKTDIGWDLTAESLEGGKVELFICFKEDAIFKELQYLLAPKLTLGQRCSENKPPNPMRSLEDRIETLEKEIAELKNKADAQDTINRDLLDVVRKLAELARPRSTGILS